MMKKTMALFLFVGLLHNAFGDGGNSLTITGEEAQFKTAGGVRGAAWNLWSAGEWAEFVHFPVPGSYEVRVVCFGSPAAGAWPEMAFMVDGVIIETVTVDSNKDKEYVFKIDAGSRDYRIGVAFLNDALTDKEDRNLYVHSMSIKAIGNNPSPTLSSMDKWHDKWATEQIGLEKGTLANAAKEIETNRKSDATVSIVNGKGEPVADAVISVELVRHEFLFGGNIYNFDRFKTPRENELYKERFSELFNYATTGFYWRWYESERGKPNYSMTDKVVDWCMKNHIRVKGHPLLWACESGIPPWCNEQPGEELRKQRIKDIMTRYAGKIEFWEVVNEPAHLPGLDIDQPYRWARETDPKAYLIVNDYDVMGNSFPPFYSMLKKALKEGTPFDGIGIQAHEPRTMRFPLDQVWKILNHYATLGKDMHITEFTPTSAGEKSQARILSGNGTSQPRLITQ